MKTIAQQRDACHARLGYHVVDVGTPGVGWVVDYGQLAAGLPGLPCHFLHAPGTIPTEGDRVVPTV